MDTDPIALQQKMLLLHFCVIHVCLKVDHSAQTATCHRSEHCGFKGIWQAGHRDASQQHMKHVTHMNSAIIMITIACSIHPPGLTTARKQQEEKKWQK